VRRARHLSHVIERGHDRPTTWVDDELEQRANTAELVFDPPTLYDLSLRSW